MIREVLALAWRCVIAAAKRLVEDLGRFGFVVMKKPPLGGYSALVQGFQK